MAMDISKANVGDMTNTVSDYSVGATSTDAAQGTKETEWQNTNWSQYLGYYKTIPELGTAIDTKAYWTVGKGYKADAKTKKILDKIKGFGKDTFNTIMENCVRTYNIGGDAFCEIIKDKKGNLVNLKPLDPSTIKIIVNSEGIIKRYEQTSKIPANDKVVAKFKKEDMFHLPWNRVADEIHGTSIIQKVEEIILMRNEAMSDMKTVFHRYVKPLWIWQLDTDDETKIKNFKAKADTTVANAENIYIPQGTAIAERVSVPQYSTLDPLPWIQNLTDYFYQATNTPDVILGSAKQTVEASAKILYLAFQQSIEKNQLFLEENIKIQLGLEVNFEFPASIAADLMQDNQKDGPPSMKKSDTTATIKGKT